MANETTLNMILKLRRDNKFVSNYKLEAGEPGFEISTNTLKIGNGSTEWKDLPIANKEVIDGLISAAIDANNDGYLTKAEVEEITGDLEDAIDALDDRVTALETTINGKAAEGGEEAVIGLVAKVDDINARIGSGFTSTDTVAKAIADINTDIGDINTAIGDSNDTKDDSTVYGAIAAEAHARAQADKAITDAIGATSDTKDKATVYGAIAAEKAAREAAIGTAATAATGTVYGAIKAVQDNLDDAVDALEEADTTLGNRIKTVEDKLTNVSNVMDFVGAKSALPAEGSNQNGDVIVITDGDNAGKEYVYDNTRPAGQKWVEFGSTSATDAAVSALQGRMDAAEGDIDDLEAEFAAGGRVTVAEGEIDDLQSRMGVAEKTIGDHTDAIDDHGTRIDALETAVETINDETDGIYAKAVKEAKRLDDDLAAALKGTKATDDTTAETIQGAKEYADLKANAAKDAVVGGDADTTQAKTVAGAKAFATAAVNQAKNDLIGTDNHTDYASTIGGAKDYAKSIVDDAVDALEDKIDGINVGVTKVSAAGTDIVVTPTTGTGDVTVAHKTYSTGTYTKTPTSSSKTGDVYFFDGITTDNGHVTGGTMKSLASILEGMTFIFDGGKSGATGDDAATN